MSEQEYKPYQINSEALLSDVLAKHPFGVFGAVKEHIDNAIDADSSEVDVSYDAKERTICVSNKSKKCYQDADIEELFHRRHHGRISQNDYGRMIIFGFTDPKALTIQTLCDSKLRTFELTPKGWKIVSEENCGKNLPEFRTRVFAKLSKDVDFEINDFKTFMNTVYNLHLFLKTVKMSVNGKPIAAVTPKGDPKTKEFEFGGHKFKGYMWNKPEWEQKIYQSMTTKGVGDGCFITAKNTLVTYSPFYRSHMGEEASYFCLVNDEEGYFAEDALDLGKLQLMFIPKVSRFFRYIKDNYLPKEKTKPSDVITEGNMFIKDFFSVGIGSYNVNPNPTSHEVKKREKKEKSDTTPEPRDTGLPELTLRSVKEFLTVPMIDIVNPKLLALNDQDPLFEKSWMKEELREVFLIRLIPFLDARKKYTPEEVADARKNWLAEDGFMRKYLKAKPKKEIPLTPEGEPIKRGRGRPRKVVAPEGATTAATPETPKKKGKTKPPEQIAQEVEAATKELDAQIAKLKPIKSWNMPTRADKKTGEQKVLTIGLFDVNGTKHRRVIATKIVQTKGKTVKNAGKTQNNPKESLASDKTLADTTKTTKKPKVEKPISA